MSAQTMPAPDIRILMAQLSDVRTIGPDTAKQILELPGKDSSARKYVVQRLGIGFTLPVMGRIVPSCTEIQTAAGAAAVCK